MEDESLYPSIYYQWMADGKFNPEQRFQHYREIFNTVGYCDIPQESVDTTKELLSKTFGDEEFVVYDIGAAIGSWSKKVTAPLQHFPNCRSILFEANPELQFLYKENGWEYHMGFLGESDGDLVPFHCHHEHIGGNSRYLENTPAFQKDFFTIFLPLERLDTVMEQREFPLPDVIKMDVQGAELDVIDGAAKCLEHTKVLIVEAQHENYNEGAPKVEEVIAHIESIGFKLWRGPVSKTPFDADYFFVKE